MSFYWMRRLLFISHDSLFLITFFFSSFFKLEISDWKPFKMWYPVFFFFYTLWRRNSYCILELSSRFLFILNSEFDLTLYNTSYSKIQCKISVLKHTFFLVNNSVCKIEGWVAQQRQYTSTDLRFLA